MPPKVKYTKEEVIAAAFDIADKRGMKALTARSVARELGSSTAPVYNYFATMNELFLEVIRKTQKTLLDYTTRSYTDRVFLNMGTGIAMFACEHKQLYRALVLEKDSYRDMVYESLDVLESELTRDKRLGPLSAVERRALLDKMWIYTHGLASLICVGLIKDCSQEFIIRNLMDVGTDVIGAALAKHRGANTTQGE